MSHTQGPWSKVPQSNGSTLIAHEYETGKQMSPKGLRMICFTMARGSSLSEDEDNASLIAAAPELLEALEAIMYGAEEWINMNLPDAVGDNARAAIAKARGKS